MSLQTVQVVSVQRRVSVREDPYLLVRLADGRFATCWDQEYWDLIDKSKDAGKPVTLDIAQAEKLSPTGSPYFNIVGIEDPGQQMLELGA